MSNREYRHQPARPDSGAMGRWLETSDVLGPGGIVRSWHNPEHPGFPYPEAAAIWLSWSSWRHERGKPCPDRDAVRAVSDDLEGRLATSGGIGRDGARFLFDTCVAIHALARAGRAFFPDSEPDGERLLSGVESFLDAGRPVLGGSGDDVRWSTSWGVHHLRSAALLTLAGRWLEVDRALELAGSIRSRAVESMSIDSKTYVHALAYGIEGELLSRAMGEETPALAPRELAERLESLLGPDGHIPAWSDGSGGPRADSTAQAVRIWAAVDPARFESASEKAIGYLAACQSGRGGLEYVRGSGDLNTWVTAFADQSVAWKTGGADPLALI